MSDRPIEGLQEVRQRVHDFELEEIKEQARADRVEHAERMREIFDQHEQVIGLKIKQLRIERGWSQQDVADRMTAYGFNMHQTTVAKVEAARRPIRVSEGFAFAAIFGLPFGALFYLPIEVGPRTLAEMQDDLREADQMVKDTEEHLETFVKNYAHFVERRDHLARAMNDAAKRYEALKAKLAQAESQPGNEDEVAQLKERLSVWGMDDGEH